MTYSRTKNSIRNTSYGFLFTIISTLLSFITRTFFIKSIGVEYLGLNGLFTELIAVISLAEMGVGMAIVYSLYRPLHDEDHEKISQLMSLFKTAYNVIALVTFLMGLILCPFVKFFIKEVDFPDYFVMLVFMMFVIRTSSSYLFSYKTSLLSADQKHYKVSIITILVNASFTVCIILSFLLFHSYLLYLTLMIAESLTLNIVISKKVDKLYPYLNLNKKLPKEERKEVFNNIKNIFIKKISWIVTSSTDNILISTIVSTIQVGYYSNYMILFKLARTIKNQLGTGFQASLGDLTVNESSEKCIMILSRLTFINAFIGGVLTSGLLAIASLFIKIWLGEAFVISTSIINIAIFNIYIEICFDPLWQNLEVSGLFKQDRNIAIIGTLTNLVVSIILGLKYGMLGIFIGTTCTLIIQLFFKTKLLFNCRFMTSPRYYFIMTLKILLGFFLIYIFQVFTVNKINTDNLILDFILKGCVSIIISMLVTAILFYGSKEWNDSKQVVKSILNKKIN